MTRNDTPAPAFDLEQATRKLAFDVRQYLGTYAEGNTFHAALGQDADRAINKGLRAAYEAGKASRPPATPALAPAEGWLGHYCPKCKGKWMWQDW